MKYVMFVYVMLRVSIVFYVCMLIGVVGYVVIVNGSSRMVELIMLLVVLMSGLMLLSLCFV